MDKLWGLIDGLLAKLKLTLNGERLDALNAKLDKLAGQGLPLAIAVIIVTGVIMSTKLDDTGMISKAVGMAIAAIALGYLSYRFSEGCRSAGAGETSTLSLTVYLDLVIVVGFLGFLGGLLGGLAQLVDGNSAGAGMMLSSSFAALILTWTLCNPDRLGVRFDSSAGATNDLVSLASIFVRVVLRIALPLSSVVVIIASVMTLLAAGLSLGAEGFEAMKYSAAVAGGTSLILGGIAAPLLVYMGYVVVSFQIGLLENILSIKEVARNTARGSGGPSLDSDA